MLNGSVGDGKEARSGVDSRLWLPQRTEAPPLSDKRLAWMEERTDGRHSKGTNIIPFSVHNIDELLGDMGLPLGSSTRFKQWLGPVDPADDQAVTHQLLQRHAAVAPSPPQARPAPSI
jgi:hypothetical protein